MTEPDPMDDIDPAATQPAATTPLRLPMSAVVAERFRPLVVAVAALAAVLIAVAAGLGYAATLGLTVGLALVLAASWPAVSGSVTPGATSLVLAASGVLVVASSVRDDLRWVAAAVAFGIVLSFFHQLLRPPVREGLVLSLLASFGGLALMASVTTLAVLTQRSGTRAFVVVGMVALVAALLADVLVGVTGLRPYLSAVALVSGVVAAIVAAWWFERVEPLDAAGLGAAVGALSWSFRRVLSGQPALLGARGQIAAGLGSVFVTGGVVHLYGLIA